MAPKSSTLALLASLFVLAQYHVIVSANDLNAEIESVRELMDQGPNAPELAPGSLTPEEATRETGLLPADECSQPENRTKPGCVIIIPASGAEVDVYVSLSLQQASVYVNDRYVHTYLVSTGMPGHSTPQGDFRVWGAERIHYSKKYENAAMPLALPFTDKYHALHCGNVSGRFLSHGCVRMEPDGCSEMWQLQGEYGFSAIAVHISQESTMVIPNKCDPRLKGSTKNCKKNFSGNREGKSSKKKIGKIFKCLFKRCN
jgi:hypothetical protein